MKEGFEMKMNLKRFVIVGIGVVFLMFTIPVVLCHLVYSDGYRDGVIRKFATKGLIIKSHEGEMGLDGLSRSVNGVWEFTVTDSDIIKQIEKVPSGAFVRLHYKQYFMNNPFYGDTPYRVVKVENMK